MPLNVCACDVPTLGEYADSHKHGVCASPCQSHRILCSCPGKPVIYYDLRRELGLGRRLLEANIQPELEGKVMPASIGE